MKSCLKTGCGCFVGVLFIFAIAVFLLKPKWHDEYGENYFGY